MTAVKWGLVGFGEQAKRMVGSLKKLGDVEIAGVCCSQEDRSKAAQECLGVQGYGHLSELLANPEIKVIYIATPHHLHTPQAFKAAEAGKHVLVEKPMALSVDGARKLIDAAKKSKIVLGVNFALRQHPGLQELKQDISSRGLGDIVQINIHLSRKGLQGEGWWRDQFHSGPMCLMDLGVQGLDLLIWLAGMPALEVSALGSGGKDDRTLNVAAAVAISFSSGAMGMVSATNTATASENFIMVQGSEKQVVAELNWPDGDGSMRVRRFQAGREEEKKYGPLDLCQASAQNFNNAVQGLGKYSPCCDETYSVVECCCAAIESLQNGTTIRAGEIQRVSGARF